MDFLKPDFLWFLLLLLIPVIIHLFNFRRYKKVIFTRVDLLKQIIVSTGTGNKLKKRIILVSRMLAMSMMILAFALPFIPGEKKEAVSESNQCIIFIDNSLSLSADGADGPLIESAKNRARALIKQMPHQMTFLLLTHDNDRIVEQKLSKPEILDEIDRINISNAFTEEEEIYRILNRISKKGDVVAVISDFRKGAFESWKEPLSNEVRLYWLKIPAIHHPNISIDSAWFETPRLMPEQSVKLMVKLSNHGKENFERIPCRLEIDGQIKGVGNVDLKAGETQTTDIVFNTGSPGWKNASLSVPGDDINFDDKLFLSFPVKQGSTGFIISSNTESAIYFKAILTKEAGFEVKTYNPVEINFSDLKSQDFLVLNELASLSDGFISELQQFTYNGGNLIVFPHPVDNQGNNKLLKSLNQPQFGKLLKGEIYTELWNLSDPLLTGIFEKKPQKPDLPFVINYYELSGGIRTNAFWKLKNNNSFMTRGPYGKGLVFVSAVPLNKTFSNLQTHHLLIPVVLRMASFKVADFQLYFYTGTEEMIPLQNIDFNPGSIFKLKNSGEEIIPEIISRDGNSYINSNGAIQNPGHYDLTDPNNKLIYRLAFNQTRKKSVTEPENDEILELRAKGLSANILTGSPQSLEAGFKELSKGKPLWKYFVFLSILFLIAEILLIRYWKA